MKVMTLILRQLILLLLSTIAFSFQLRSKNVPTENLLWGSTYKSCYRTNPQLFPTTSEKQSHTALKSSFSASSSSSTPPPRQLLSKGMQIFREGDIQGSIELFDAVDKSAPDGSLRPYLWQRGISYYYADRFQDGSDQFRLDVKVNPLDVEEIVWDIACLSRIDSSTLPPPQMMSLPKGKKDRRKIMSTVYSLFRGEALEQDLAVAGHKGSASDEFYALFYLGLYNESRGDVGKAENYMKSAATSPYATGLGSGDYMSSCAKVHCKIRGWL